MLYLLRSKLKKSQMSLFDWHNPEPHHKAYERHLASGKTVRIEAKGPQTEGREKLQHGMSVLYRGPDMPKRRKGTIIGSDETGWHVAGKRQGYIELNHQTMTLPREQIWTEAEHAADKSKGDKFEATSAHGRRLKTEVVNQRAALGTERLGMSETEVLAHPAVTRSMMIQLGRITRSNHIETPYTIKNGMLSNDDATAMDMYSEYATALINSLRRQTANAPDEMVSEFRDHLQGQRNDSRIFATMIKDGKSAAIRHAIELQEHHNTHDEYNTSAEDDFEAGMQDISAQNATPHYAESEQKDRVERDNAIENALSEMKPAAADLIKRKFGLGDYREPQSSAKIAREMGTSKEKVERAVQLALMAFAKTKGSNALRHFLKSLQEEIDLRKSLKAEDDLIKSHIKQYTRMDGTVVQEHDDKRVKKHPDLIAHENKHGDQIHSGSTMKHGADLLEHLKQRGWKSKEVSAVRKKEGAKAGSKEDMPGPGSIKGKNQENPALQSAQRTIHKMHEAVKNGSDPAATLQAFNTSRSNPYLAAVDDEKKKLLEHFGHETDDSQKHTKLDKDGHTLIVSQDGDKHTVEFAGGDADAKNDKPVGSLTGKKEVESVDTGKKEAKFIVGRENKAYTAKLNPVHSKYALVEADQLTTSHTIQGHVNKAYPQEIQPRERERMSSQMQMANIMNDVKPELFGHSATAADGAPIVGKDGAVESGNGRTIALTEAYNRGLADKYKEWLHTEAEHFGLKPEDVAGMKNPMLVRLRDEDDPNKDRAEFAREANQSSNLGSSPAEQAWSDSERIDDALLKKFTVDEDGEIYNDDNMDFINGFLDKLGKNESASLRDADGDPNKKAIERIQNAVFTKVYGSSMLTELQAESAKPKIRNVLKALNSCVADFAQVKGHDDLDVVPDMMEAIEYTLAHQNESKAELEYKLKNAGALDFTGDTPAFKTEHATNMILAIADRTGSRNKLENVFRAISNEIKTEVASRENPEVDMFSGPHVDKTKEQVVKQALDKVHSGNEIQKSHVHTYTKQDGTLVEEHDDKRTKHVAEKPAHKSGAGEVMEKGTLMVWAKSWTWGRDGKKADVYDLPSDKVVAQAAKYVPKKPVTLYRAHTKGQPEEELQSWSHDKELIEQMADDMDREVLTQTFHPDQIMIDFDMLDPQAKKHVLQTDFSEVVVANGKTLERIRTIRGQKNDVQKSQYAAGLYLLKKSIRRNHEKGIERRREIPSQSSNAEKGTGCSGRSRQKGRSESRLRKSQGEGSQGQEAGAEGAGERSRQEAGREGRIAGPWLIKSHIRATSFVNERGTRVNRRDHNDKRTKKQHDTGQLAFNFDFRPGTSDGDKADSISLCRRTSELLMRRSGSTVLGNAVANELTTRGTATFIGREIKAPSDLAALAQVFRNPKFETMRYFFTKGDVIVGQTGVSSRLPSVTAVFPGPADQPPASGISWAKDQMKACGADGYYVMHNHPSGNVVASKPDENFTKVISNLLPGFKGHLIINHNKYNWIDKNHNSTIHMEEFSDKPDPHLQQAKPHQILGRTITEPGQLADLANELKIQDGYFLVVTRRSAGAGIGGLLEVPVGTSKKKFAAIIKKFSIQTAASDAFIVSPRNLTLDQRSMAKQAMQYGYVRDVIEDGRSIVVEKISPYLFFGKKLAGKKVHAGSDEIQKSVTSQGVWLIKSWRLRKSQMAFDFTGSAHDHHVAYTRTNASGTVSRIQAKGAPRKIYHAGADIPTHKLNSDTYWTHDKEVAEKGYLNSRPGETGKLHEADFHGDKPAGDDIVLKTARKLGFDQDEIEMYTPATIFDKNVFPAKLVDKLKAELTKQGYSHIEATDITPPGEYQKEFKAVILLNPAKQPWQQTKEQYGNDEDHEVQVYRAMQQGKPVPAEVREQYPQFGYLHRDSKKHLKKSIAGTFLLRKSHIPTELITNGRGTSFVRREHEDVRNAFIRTKSGKAHFGEIDLQTAKEAGIARGKIMLKHGEHTGPHKGYGLKHITAEHGSEIAADGYSSPEDFVQYVAENYNAIYKAKRGRLALVVEGPPQKVAIIEVRRSNKGGYYSVFTAYPPKNIKFTGTALWRGRQPSQSVPESQQPLHVIEGDHPVLVTKNLGHPTSTSGQSASGANNISPSKNEFNKSLRPGLWLRKSVALAGRGAIRHFAPAVFLCGDKAISHTNVAEFSGGKGGSGSGGDFIGRNKLAAAVPAFAIDVDHNTLQKPESPSAEVKAPPQNDLTKAHVAEYDRTTASGALAHVLAHEDSRVKKYGKQLMKIRNHADLHNVRKERFAHLPHWGSLPEHTQNEILLAEEHLHRQISRFEKPEEKPDADKVDRSDWKQARLFKSRRRQAKTKLLKLQGMSVILRRNL